MFVVFLSSNDRRKWVNSAFRKTPLFKNCRCERLSLLYISKIEIYNPLSALLLTLVCHFYYVLPRVAVFVLNVAIATYFARRQKRIVHKNSFMENLPGQSCPIFYRTTLTEAKMHANFCRRNGTAFPSLQTRVDYHTLVMFYKIHTKQAPSYLTSLFPPLSSRSEYTFRKLSYRFSTVSKPQLPTVSYLEQLLCGMPYPLMFNMQAQSMLLRSFSNPILKYKPSTILLWFPFLIFFS